MDTSRGGEILETLGPRIVNQQILAGEVLTLADIAEEFGVSRTVARDVMRSLESINLVRSSRRVGIVVQPMRMWNVFDLRIVRWRLGGNTHDEQLTSLLQLRLAIEPKAAGAAARFASREQRAQLLVLAGQLRELGEAGRLHEFMDIDIAFHEAIFEASGNEFFRALSPTIGIVLRWRTELDLMPPQPEPRALDDHETVARAIHNGNVAVAESAMRDLVNEVQDAFDSSSPNILKYW